MKNTIILISVICLGTLNLSAQGIKTLGKKVVQESRNAAHNTRLFRQTSRVSSTLPQTTVVTKSIPTISSTFQAPLQRTVAASQMDAAVVPGSLQQIQHDIAASAQLNTGTGALMEQIQTEIFTQEQLLQEAAGYQFGGLDRGFGKSVLFAPVEHPDKVQGFSVTVFKTTYQGKEETFGVIASHVLPESYYTFSSSLQRNFQVHVQQADGTSVLIPASVVQISPRSMLDISLVKFPAEAENLLSPLELADTPAQIDEILLSYGFALGQPHDPIQRQVHNTSFISVRTDQHLDGSRQGFCGSPLLDSSGKIKAIHTGTLERKNQPDVSYGTHAQFINVLVEAYHNNGQAHYDLIINDQTLARLNVDEYISAIYLYDENGKRLAQKNIEDKFSQTTLTTMLADNPRAVYLQLTSRKAQWEVDQDEDAILKEDRSKRDTTKQQHWYNLQTQQIEETRPSIIQM